MLTMSTGRMLRERDRRYFRPLMQFMILCVAVVFAYWLATAGIASWLPEVWKVWGLCLLSLLAAYLSFRIRFLTGVRFALACAAVFAVGALAIPIAREVETANNRYWCGAAIIAMALIIVAYWEHRSIRGAGFDLLPPGDEFKKKPRFLSLAEYLGELRWRKGQPSGLFLGRPLPQHRPFGLFGSSWVGLRDDRHMLTIGANRSGKGTGALTPNLLFYPGSAVVIDPKGELARLTAARRGNGFGRIEDCLQQEVYIIDLLVDPTGPALASTSNHLPSGHVKAQWNPLAEIQPGDPGLVAKVRSMVFALIPDEPNAKDPFFISQARDLLAALIQHVVWAEPEEHRNLIYVRKLLQQGDVELFEMIEEECGLSGETNPYADPFEALLHLMSNNTNEKGKIQGFARRFLSMPADTRHTVVSDLYGRTSFLDSHKLEHMLTGSSFRLADLKRKPMTIYFCASGSQLGIELKNIAYIFVDLAIRAMEETPHAPACQVLFAMDEFSSLGYHEMVEKGMGLVAGKPFSVKLWPVIQSMAQLEKDYPKTWKLFLANCGAVQFIGQQDESVVETIVDELGKREVKQRDGSIKLEDLISKNWLSTGFFNFESGRQIVKIAGLFYAPLERCDYYRFDWMKRLVDEDIDKR